MYNWKSPVMKKLRTVAPIVLSALLIGCTSSATKQEQEEAKQKAIETQISKDDLLKVIDMDASSKNVDAATQISNAADSVSRSMNKLARIAESMICDDLLFLATDDCLQLSDAPCCSASKLEHDCIA